MGEQRCNLSLNYSLSTHGSVAARGTTCHRQNHGGKAGAGRLQEKCHPAPAETNIGGPGTSSPTRPPRSSTNGCAKGWKIGPCQLGAGDAAVSVLDELAVVDQV